jgi:hypothetical protein
MSVTTADSPELHSTVDDDLDVEAAVDLDAAEDDLPSWIPETLKPAFTLGHAKGQKVTESMKQASLGQSMTFQNMIRAAVTLGIGVVVTAEVFNAFPSVSGPIGNATTQVENLTGTAFELAPVVLIVIVAGLVLGAIRGF